MAKSERQLHWGNHCISYPTGIRLCIACGAALLLCHCDLRTNKVKCQYVFWDFVSCDHIILILYCLSSSCILDGRQY